MANKIFSTTEFMKLFFRHIYLGKSTKIKSPEKIKVDLRDIMVYNKCMSKQNPGKEKEKMESHLESNCDIHCTNPDCKQMVKQSVTGRWWITSGHAGFNSPANNRQGYKSEALARNASRSYSMKGQIRREQDHNVEVLKRLNDSKQTRDLDMFGCSGDLLLEALNNPINQLVGPEMFVMSILSDAQELLAQDCEQNANKVRQYMNRAKFVLDSMIRTRNESSTHVHSSDSCTPKCNPKGIKMSKFHNGLS